MKARTTNDRAPNSTLAKRAERAYRAALERLIQGKATYAKHAGRPVKITPASVAREAGLSRNPLYTTHRTLLSEIEAATQRPTPAADLAATVGKLEAQVGSFTPTFGASPRKSDCSQPRISRLAPPSAASRGPSRIP